MAIRNTYSRGIGMFLLIIISLQFAGCKKKKVREEETRLETPVPDSMVSTGTFERIFADVPGDFGSIMHTYLDHEDEIREFASPREQKEFLRWKNFVSYRVDEKGTLQGMSEAIRSNWKNFGPKGLYTGAGNLCLNKLEFIPIGPTDATIIKQSGVSYSQNAGQVSAVWVDPVDNDHILMGGRTGGLWETRDRGVNWRCLTDELFAVGIHDIEVDPANSQVIYIAAASHAVGTLSYLQSWTGYSYGIYKSTDGGLNWTDISPHGVGTITSEYRDIEIHPFNSNRIIALSSHEVYRSYDAGATWESLNITKQDPRESYLSMELIDWHQGGGVDKLYLCGHYCMYMMERPFYKSSYGPQPWQDMRSRLRTNAPNGNNPAYEIKMTSVAKNPVDGKLYVFYTYDLPVSPGSTTILHHHVIRKSSDRGLTFEPGALDRGSFGSNFPGYVRSFGISPNGHIFAGGIGLEMFPYAPGHFLCPPGWDHYPMSTIGAAWDTYHPDIRDIEFAIFNGDPVFVLANDGGLCYGKEAAPRNNYGYLTQNVQIGQYFEFDVLDSDPRHIAMGGMDNGTFWRDVATGKWKHAFSCDGGGTLYEPGNLGRLYLTCNHHLLRYMGSMSNTLNLNSNGHFYDSPLVHHPVSPNVIYTAYEGPSGGAGDDYLRKSTNGGTNWTRYSPLGWHSSALAFAPSNPDLAYHATTRDFPFQPRLWKKDLSNLSDPDAWINIGTSLNLPQATMITDIEVHPQDPGHVWITVSGFSANNKVFETKDGGATWTNISSGLPNFPVQCAAYHAQYDLLIVGTDIGIFSKFGGHAGWAVYNSAQPKRLPNTIISDLEIIDDEVYVCTFGRGIYKSEIPYQEMACLQSNQHVFNPKEE